MGRETRIRAKLRELAEAMHRLAQHVPGEDGAELERCALDLHFSAADRALQGAGAVRRAPMH